MARDRTAQPMTKDNRNLLIGLMKCFVGGENLGALKSAGLTMQPTFKEHKAGYPQTTDLKMADVLSGTYKFETEEITSDLMISILEEILVSADVGTPIFKQIRAIGEFALGGYIQFDSVYAQLKPNLTLNIDNDFGMLPLEFEALLDPSADPPNNLVDISKVAGDARSLENQPLTTDVNNLVIGRPQLRIGTIIGGPTNVDTAGVNSVGAMKSASLSINTTLKEHFSGFPQVRDLLMVESTVIEISAELEEVDPDSDLIAKLFDSANTGALWYAPVELVFQTANGRLFTFKLPNMQLEPSINFNPGNDWASFGVKLTATKNPANMGLRRITLVVDDLTVPTAVTLSPIAGANAVAVGAKTTAIFSEEMDAATMIAANFTLKKNAGAVPVAGAVTYDEIKRKITFTPAAPLEAATLYDAVITVGAKDKTGNALGAPVTWSFTTA